MKRSEILIEGTIISNENILVNKGNLLHRIIMMIVLCQSLFYTIFNYALGNTIQAYITLSLVPVSIIAYIFSLSGYTILSKIFNLICVMGVISVLALLVGKETGILFFFIPICVSTLIVFQGKERWLGYLLTGISFIIFLFLILSNYRITEGNEMNPREIEIEWMLNIGGSCLVTVMELLFILTISNSIQRQLIEKSNSINAINKELNATIHTRDKMISVISHDVRGPLSLINSGLNLVNWEANLDKDEKEIVKELQKRADATVNLIDNLVLWSRSQTKEIHYSPKLLSNNDLNDILNNILTLQNSKGIRINWQLTEGGNVFTDKNLLQAILRNLLSNAVKFTSIGGSITVKTNTLDEGTEISITDSGMGMNDETIHKIESGISHTSLGTENEKGHGIGLQLVSEFLEKSSSKLHIKSTLGKGSTFSFILGSKA